MTSEPPPLDHDAQATDTVLNDYWAMCLRAEQLRDGLREEETPLQRDHQQRTESLSQLYHQKNLIEQDIRAQKAMLRTVAAQLGDLATRRESARRVMERHEATVAGIVRETGRPHPRERFEEARRRAIADQAAHAAHNGVQPAQGSAGQVAALPPAEAPTELGSAADTDNDGDGTGGIGPFNGRQHLNGATP